MKNIIYAIFNKKTGEDIYIGKTARESEKRFKEHLRELKTGWHHNLQLQLEYERLGEENVGFKIIEKVKTLSEIEREHIKKNSKLTNEA